MINRSFLLKNIPSDWKFIVEKEIKKNYFDEIIKEINLSYQKANTTTLTRKNFPCV